MSPMSCFCLKPARCCPWPILLLGAAACYSTHAAVVDAQPGTSLYVIAPTGGYSTTSAGSSGTVLNAGQTGSYINVSPGLTIKTTGSGAHAVTAANGGNIELSSLTLTTTGTASRGLAATAGGTISVSGPATLTTSGISLYVDGSGSAITGTNVTAKATGTSSLAANVTNGGKLILNGSASSLTNNIAGSYVASVTGTGSKMDLTNTTVSSQAASNHGIYVADGASLTMNGGSVISKGADKQALRIIGSGTVVNLTGTSLQTSGDRTVIVYAQDGAQVTLTNTQLQFSGDTGEETHSALVAQSGSTITMNGGSINYTGNGGNGANSFFSGSNLNLNGVSVTTNGTGSWGVLSQAGALNIQDSQIVTLGADSDGVHLSDNYSTFGSGSSVAFKGSNTILTQGPNSHGIALDGGAQLTLGAANNPLPAITVQGSDSALIHVDGQYNGQPSKVTLQGAAQLVNGGTFNNTIGAYVSNGGQFEFSAGSGATMTGTNSDAVRVIGENSLVSGDQTSLSVNGSNAHAAHLADGGSLNLTSSTLRAQGNQASALYMTSTDTGNIRALAVLSNSATLTDSTLSATNGPVIAIEGGDALITLAHSLIDSSGGIAMQVGPNNTATPGSVTLQADNTHIIGAILTDTVSSSTITLQNNSLWDINADSAVTQLTNGASTIQFTSPSAGLFKTLTVRGNYQGSTGSAIVLNTQLGNDQSPTDKLIILGDTAGTSGIRVINAGGSGALTTADGIEIIQIGGTSGGSFTLLTPVVAGAYEYSLYKGGQNGSGGNWYLRSSTELTTPVDPVDPVDPPDPENPTTPQTPRVTPRTTAQAIPARVYRGDAGAYIANQAAAMMFLHTLHDRLGEPQFTDNNRQTGSTPSFWIRTTGSRTNYQAGNQGEFDLRTDISLVQLGAELAHWTDNSDNRLHFGIMGGYGSADSDSDMRNPDGVLKHSSGNTDGYSLGLYATWFGNHDKPSGPYVDVWAQYGWYDNSVDYTNTPTQSYNSHNVTVSIEAGYAFKLSDLRNERALMLEPQAQVAYTNYRADKHVDYSGTIINSDDDGVITRLGARLYSRPLNGTGAQPFIETNWWHSDTSSVSFNGTSIDSQAPTDRFEIKAGVQGELAKGWQAWLHAGYQTGSDGYNRIEGLIGVKHLF